MNIPFFRRMPPPEITPEVPVDPVEEIFAEGEQFLGSGPAAEALKSHMGQVPNPNDFAPSIAKRGVSALAAALAGFGQNSALAGASLGNNMIEAPYRHALDNYNKKAKSLGEVAELEENERKETRLWATSRAGIIARREEAEARRKSAQNKPGRTFKPEALRDKLGVLTGEMIVYGPDGPEKIEVPGVRGARTNAESPGITQKKAANAVAASKAQELLNIFDELTEEHKGNPLGNPHTGPIQGTISEWASGTGLNDNPKVRDLHKLTEELSNERLYAMSGAQINNKEYERLRRTMADTKKSDAAFRTDLLRFMKFHEAAANGLISENDVDWTPESGADKLPESTNVPVNSETDISTPAPTTTRKYKLRIER